VIDGFHVTGASEDGIRVDTHADRAAIANNVVFDNGKRGIRVINSEQVQVHNNLVVGNSGGIQLGGQCVTGEDCATAGSRRAVVEHNTAFRNEFNGIQVGDGEGVSSRATLRYNVTGENGENGIEVGNNLNREDNLVGYASSYNLVGDLYATGVPRGVGDLLLDLAVEPLYVDPSVVDVDGDWLLDQHWRLMSDSRAVDFSDQTAEEAGMADRSTRSDGGPDTGLVDRGYHYPRRAGGPLAGDCNGDGAVTVNELILAVNIGLGNAPMSACTAVDVDGSGIVEVNELVRAVNNAAQG
jgi:parallel beta-helix repeat protein